MATCAELTAYWDQAIGGFLAGGPAVPPGPRMQSWFEANRGRGEVNLAALPEPYLGALDHRPVGVFLALHPGKAEPGFQGRSGRFADEIRQLGGYSGWAATWPYLRNPWVAAMRGPSPFLTFRRRFLGTWTSQPALTADAMVVVELYPWHIATMTGIQPDPGIVREFIWQPVHELGAPVFAFGKPWFDLLEHGLGPQVVDRLGAGGRPYATEVPSRAVLVLRDQDGPVIIAVWQMGFAGPPSRLETLVLREAIEPWLGHP